MAEISTRFAAPFRAVSTTPPGVSATALQEVFAARDGSRFNTRVLSHPGLLECGGKRSATPLCAERLASAVHPALTGPKPACSQAFTTPHATDEARTAAGFSLNSRRFQPPVLRARCSSPGGAVLCAQRNGGA